MFNPKLKNTDIFKGNEKRGRGDREEGSERRERERGTQIRERICHVQSNLSRV